MRQETTVLALARLTKTVSTGMPEHFPALRSLKKHIRDGAIAFQRTTQIPVFLPIDLCNDNTGTQFLRHILKKLSGSGLPGLRRNRGGASIADIEGHVDFGMRLVFDLLEMLLP